MTTPALRVVSQYDVSEWVSVRIAETVEGKLIYQVVEPVLTEDARKIYDVTMRRIFDDVGLIEKFYRSPDFEDAVELASGLVADVVSEYESSLLVHLLSRRGRRRLSQEEVGWIAYYIARDLVGYGRLDPLIRDPRVEDITCDGLNIPVYVFHSEYEWLETNIVFTSPSDLEKIVYRLAYKAGIEPSSAQPIVEGVLQPEGYRVHIVLDAVSPKGHTFTIRRFREVPFTIIDLIDRRMIDPWLAALLWIAVENKIGIVIYGVTGAGKTTLLNSVAMLLPPEYKIVTVEDTPEINLPFHENWVRLVSRRSTDPSVQNVTLQTLIESAMRQRPEVLIVGEIRALEAHPFFQAVTSGHGGLTTIHAEDTVSLIKRLSSPPLNVPKSIISSARLYVGVQRTIRGDKVIRRVTRIHEVEEYNPDRDLIQFREVAKWWKDEDIWSIYPEPKTLEHIAEINAVPSEEVMRDYHMRAAIMEYASREKLDIVSLQVLIRRYRRNPLKVYEEAVRTIGKRREPLLAEGEIILV